MKQNYFKFIENLQDEGKTYFTVEYGSGNQNSGLEPSGDEFMVFETLEEAEVEFEKMINVIRDENNYISIEIWKEENNYIAETIKIHYTTLVNYYQLDHGWIEHDGGHSSYGIEEDKFERLEEALEELKSRTIEKNDYIDLNYFEDGEYEDTIHTFYGPEAKKIKAKDYHGSVLALILQEARTRKQLTQQEVANKLEVAVSTYQRYEYGNRFPDGKTMIKLINILDLNPQEIENII